MKHVGKTRIGQVLEQSGCAIPALLDAKQLTGILFISARKIHQDTKSGAIRSVRLGRLVRYDPRDIEAYIRSRKVGGDDPLTTPRTVGGAAPERASQ